MTDADILQGGSHIWYKIYVNETQTFQSRRPTPIQLGSFFREEEVLNQQILYDLGIDFSYVHLKMTPSGIHNGMETDIHN